MNVLCICDKFSTSAFNWYTVSCIFTPINIKVDVPLIRCYSCMVSVHFLNRMLAVANEMDFALMEPWVPLGRSYTYIYHSVPCQYQHDLDLLHIKYIVWIQYMFQIIHWNCGFILIIQKIPTASCRKTI